MERFDFHPQERDFVAEPSRRYIGQLPECMADNNLPDDVARVALFQLAERNGTTLRFMSGAGYATPYIGKPLKNSVTGVEVCVVKHEGAQIMLEATNYMIGGRRFVRRELK